MDHDMVKRYLDEMLNYSERRMRAALKQIPVGTYEFEDVMEGDGITDCADHNPRQDRVEGRLRLSPTSRRATTPAKGPLNCRWPSVAACVYYVLKACLDPELPPNAGAYRPIDDQGTGGQPPVREIPDGRVQREHNHFAANHRRATWRACAGHSQKRCWRPARAR